MDDHVVFAQDGSFFVGRKQYSKRSACECSDPGCPAHSGVSECSRRGVVTVYRIDMEDESGTRMCRACSEDAMDSGVFTAK